MITAATEAARSSPQRNGDAPRPPEPPRDHQIVSLAREARRRRSTRLVYSAVAVAAALIVASCHSSDRGAGRDGTGTAPTTTTSTGVPPPPTRTCTTPTEASRTVVAGWIANDRVTAGRCATPDAVATLFADQGRAAGWTFQGCDGPDPGVPLCSFASNSRAARLTLHGTEAAGWTVDRVELRKR